MNGNYNNNNYNNISYNNPINLSVQEEEQAVQVSDAIDEMDEVSAYIEIIKENIEYEHLIDAKKVLLQNFPYLLFAYFFNKMAWLYRISTKEEAFDKVFDMINRFDQAFTNPLPSFHVQDILIGVAGGIAFKLIVYYKAKNAKKFRYGREYGSARWGNAKDMEPYVDPVFENNVILTETERLMMSGRPKEPKYARNKNILVIGGSGSGKTRFFVKPNLMQMHSSYVTTDPKGYIGVGQLNSHFEKMEAKHE